MKKISPLGLLGMLALSAGVALGSGAAEQQTQEQDLESVFVNADGFEQVQTNEIDDWFDDSWYQSEQFPGMSTDSVFFPDAQMSPLERATLLFDYLEGQLPHARYRIQMGTDFSTVGQMGQGPMAFVEVTRFNLGPALHEDLQTQYDQVADLEEFGVGPHVSRRFIFTPIQGMNAHVVAAGRQELSDQQVADMMCFEQSCLVLQQIEGKAGAWESIPVPSWVGQNGTTLEDAQQLGTGENATVAYAVREITEANLGSEYGEPVESITAPEPYFEIIVSKNVTGQVPALEVVSHQGHLMDDSLSDIWYRWIQVDGSEPYWERLAEHRPPMIF